jgi:hypothetical protein
LAKRKDTHGEITNGFSLTGRILYTKTKRTLNTGVGERFVDETIGGIERRIRKPDERKGRRLG